jgi:chromosome segregation ATPase
MSAALAVLARLPWRIIGPAIGGVLLIWAAYGWAYDRGRASRDGEVATIVRERDTAIGNTARLRAAIAAQNETLDALRARSEAARSEADRAATLANQRRQQLAGARAKVDALARSQGSCVDPVPAAVMDLWERL